MYIKNSANTVFGRVFMFFNGTHVCKYVILLIKFIFSRYVSIGKNVVIIQALPVQKLKSVMSIFTN